MIKRIAVLLLATIAFGAAAIGCGDDSSDDTGIETSSLTKAEFVKRADEICNEGAEESFEGLSSYIQKNKSKSKSEEELAAEAIQQAVLPNLESQADEIEDLGAPTGDERQLEAFLAAQRRSFETLSKRQTLSLATELSAAFREPSKLARQYGINACAYA